MLDTRKAARARAVATPEVRWSLSGMVSGKFRESQAGEMGALMQDFLACTLVSPRWWIGSNKDFNRSSPFIDDTFDQDKSYAMETITY